MYQYFVIVISAVYADDTYLLQTTAPQTPAENCQTMSGNIYIGGLVNIHRVSEVIDDSLTEGPIKEKCSEPYDNGIYTSLSIIHAIEEINSRTYLDLKNVTLGYVLADSCRSRTGALRGTIQLSSGTCGPEEAPIAVVADTFSGSLSPVAHYLQLTTTPLIAVFSTSVEFTNMEFYPTFFRTVPNDDHQSEALVHIVDSFNWKWVGAIATDENYGHYGVSHFKEIAMKRGICLAFESYVPTFIDSNSVSDVVDLIMKYPKVKVIITFISSGYEVLKVLEECDKKNIDKKVWIGTDAWIISRIFASNVFYNVIDAVIGTSIEEVRNEDFWNYFLSRKPNNTNLNSWFIEYWEKIFSCQLFNYKENNETEVNQECWSHSLEEKADEFRTFIDFTTYNAVYAIGYAIYDIIECRPPNGLLQDGRCPDINNLEPWALMQYLRNVNFTHPIIKDRQFMFDDNYEVLARYTDGYFSNEENTKCLLKPLAVVEWRDPVVIGFLIWSGVGCIFTFITVAIFFVKRESEVVKYSSRDLSVILQIGIIAGYLSSILFLIPPTDVICQLRIAVPSIIACLLLAVFLIKIYMVIKIFNRGKKGKSMINVKIRFIKFRLLFVLLITGFQICIVLLSYFTFSVKKVEDIKSSTKETIIECNVTIEAYISNELFNLMLIIVCFVFAFRARKMPHNYHEARFISVVMTFWIIIFLLSITTHLFTVGELQSIIAVMFVLILYTLILIMLFVPKCYILAMNKNNNAGNPIKSSGSCATISTIRETEIQHCSHI
ncbi:extracellular calcium-sensing receptor-like [Antedon mediterranea]|uniref:extracellular calcium-sensing receptor-like n=1 Tax=Antedon mediterranea TaxID=105859 RepID=UPI003AF877D6